MALLTDRKFRRLSNMIETQKPITSRKNPVCQEVRIVELLRELSQVKRDKMFLTDVYHAAHHAMAQFRAASETAVINHYLHPTASEHSHQDWLSLSTDLSSIIADFMNDVARAEGDWYLKGDLEDRIERDIALHGRL